MSKPETFGILLILFFTACPSFLWGSEKLPQISLSREFQDEDPFVRNFPLFYSYDSAQWISSIPLKRLTHAEDQGGVTLPYLKQNPLPVPYPIMALERKLQGKVLVAIEVRIDGTVGRWKIMSSSGHKILDEAAIRAIQAWQFEPARSQDGPIASCIQVPIDFRIEGQQRR